MKKNIFLTTIIIFIAVLCVYYFWFMQKNELVTKEGILLGSKGNTLIVDDVFVEISNEDYKQYLNKRVKVEGYLSEPKPCPPNLQCQISPIMTVKSIEIIE